jgi:hypothetical protein
MAVAKPTLLSAIDSPDYMSFSLTTRDNKMARLPRLVVGDIVVEGRITWTGTTPNNTLNHAIQRFYIGEEPNLKVEAYPDELSLCIDALKPGLSTGYNDGLATQPVSTTQYRVHLRFAGPFNLTNCQYPTVYMDLDPTGFGAGISAFTALFRVHLMPYGGDTPTRLFRRSKGSLTSQNVAVGQPGQRVDGVLIMIGAGDLVTQIYLANALGTLVYNYPDANRALLAAEAWAAYKQVALAASPTVYLLRGTLVEYYPGRSVQVELSSASTITVWAISPDP